MDIKQIIINLIFWPILEKKLIWVKPFIYKKSIFYINQLFDF